MPLRTLKSSWQFLLEIYREWDNDNCFRLAAALSYYTLFSIAPLLIIVIEVAGTFYGAEAVSGEIYSQAKGLVGPEGAKAIQNMVENAYRHQTGWIATAISTGTLIFSATVTFTVLQDSLNHIWKVRTHPERGFIKFLIARAISFVMVLTVGFLLIVSLVVNAIIAALHDTISILLNRFSVYLIEGVQFIISFAIITLLFGLMLKYLPDVYIRWRNVWRASLLTSALFTIGKYFIGLYLGRSNLASAYGAAGSLVIVIVWINYSSWIFFLGAEYIYVLTRRRGELVRPTRYAVRVVTRQVEDESPEAKPLT